MGVINVFRLLKHKSLDFSLSLAFPDEVGRNGDLLRLTDGAANNKLRDHTLGGRSYRERHTLATVLARHEVGQCLHLHGSERFVVYILQHAHPSATIIELLRIYSHLNMKSWQLNGCYYT